MSIAEQAHLVAESTRRPAAAAGAGAPGPASVGEAMHALVSELYPICRSITGDGVRTTLARLAELRGLYEPFAAALALHFRLNLPDVWPEQERPDNWQTSAWMRRAGPLTALGTDPRDDHFA